jgi:hypothetical protein
MGARSFWRGGCLLGAVTMICAIGATATASAGVRVNSWRDTRFPTGPHLDVSPTVYREVADDRVVIGYDQATNEYRVTGR